MRTDPSLFSRPTFGRSAVCAAVVLFLAAGCAHHSTALKNAPTFSPPVVDAAEVMRRDTVAARTRELIRSGKYKTATDARRAAEQENPAPASTDGAQEAEYLHWKQQRAAQVKFEGELAKMKRSP